MTAVTDAVLAIGICVIYAAVGVVVVRKLMQGKVREGHNDTIAPMFATAGVIYAVLLGFLVVVGWTHVIEHSAILVPKKTLVTCA